MLLEERGGISFAKRWRGSEMTLASKGFVVGVITPTKLSLSFLLASECSEGDFTSQEQSTAEATLFVDLDAPAVSSNEISGEGPNSGSPFVTSHDGELHAVLPTASGKHVKLLGCAQFSWMTRRSSRSVS